MSRLPSAGLGHILSHAAHGQLGPIRRRAGNEENMGFRDSGVIEAPVDEVFAWHERPGALPRLVPPWQPIRVLEEASSLRDGKAVLRLPGGVRWVAQHGGYEPPRQFVDELVSLPLRWRHTHFFEPVTRRPHGSPTSWRRPCPGRSSCRRSATGTGSSPPTWPHSEP